MADINEIYAQTPEYRNYVQKSGDKEPTVEKFLETMSPQQRVEFERKYGGKDDRAAEVQKKDKPVEELENVAETERLRSMYSDQNEIWLDRIRVKVLQSMNKVDGSINVDTLPVEQLVEEVKKAEALKEDEQRQYRRAVEKSLEAEMNFDLVPPKALVEWEKHLNKDIAEAKSKDAGADTTNEETVLAAVHGRMDNLINDMADRSGMYWVDKSNIADVYDGYLEMIELRSQNKKGTPAKGILDEWMSKYEHDFGLDGKTENDAAVLERIAADTERKLEDFQLDSDSRTILNALNVAGARREDIEEILVLAAKSDALDDQVLIEGKAAGKKDVHAAVNDQFVKNVTMLVNADRESKKQPSVPFDVLRAELLSGKTYEVSAEGFDGARDAWVNKKTSKLARLGKKIGKSAPALGRLYAPVRKLDKLAEARFEEKADTKKYRRQFWTGLAGNAALVGTISAGFAVASRIPGGQTYCAYASAGLAVVGMTVAYQQRRRAAHAQGKKYNFFKDPEGMTSVLMSGAAMAAVAWGRPEGLYAVMGANMVRTGYFSYKKAKKAGIKKGEAAAMTAAAVLTTPLAAWAGHAVGTHIGDSLAGENGPFGHWAEKDGEIIPGEKHDIKTYEQKHIDKAEIWNNSDGVSHGARYTPDGSQPMESAFHAHGTYNEALNNLQQHHTGWAPEAADVNLAKLENAHLLGAPDTPLSYDPSKTLGETDANGNHITYDDVFKHLTTDPQTPLSEAEIQVMDKVAQHISADANGHMGHLIPDVGIKPEDLYSYDPSRPDGIIHDVTQEPDRVIPGEKVWVPNPAEKIVPYIPPYFFAQVKKLKQIKEKIGSLADRIVKKKNGGSDKVGVTPPNNGKEDKIGIVAPSNGGKDDKTGVVIPGDRDNSDAVPVTPVPTDKNEALAEKLAGLQGDNVYYGPTSGEVAYNEVEGLEDKPETKRTAKEDVKTPPRYELTDKDKETPEYSEALSKALDGDANAVEAYRQKREKEEAAKSEVQEHIQKRKEELRARQHEWKGKMHGSVVADKFAEEDIHGVEISENTPEGYKQAQKQREADKKEFRETGKIARFMKIFQVAPSNGGKDDKTGVVIPGDRDNSDAVPVTPVPTDKNEALAEKLAGLQGDNVYYGPTSGEVAYNEVEGLEDKPETKRTAKEDVKTPPRYELTDKDKETPEYSEALSKALDGDANAVEAYRQKREKEEAAKSEVQEHIQKRKEELRARQHEWKGKMHGSVVADKFAEEDIHGVEISENTPEGYKQAQKQREADKKEFRETGKIARFMKIFQREK